MANSPHPILLLTPAEVTNIQTWIAKNGYSLDEGHFELIYDFWIRGPGIRIQWSPDSEDEYTWLELREDGYGDNPANMQETVDIAGRRVPLVLPEELRKRWLDRAAARTEAEVNADCEPSGSSLHLKIQRHVTQVLIRNEWIDLQEVS